jgi:hypothetical protein
MTADEIARRLDELKPLSPERAGLERKLAACGTATLDLIEQRTVTSPPRWTARVLRMMRGDAVIPRLVAWMSHRELDGFAIEALGHSRRREALAPLLALLPEDQLYVAPALAELGLPEAIPALEALWNSRRLEPWEQATVGMALVRLGVPGLEPELGRIYAESVDPSPANIAADGLSWCATPEAVRALRGSLARPVEAQRQAIEALGALGLAAAAPLLIELAEEQPRCIPYVYSALCGIFGRELPRDRPWPADTIVALRAWWDRTHDRWPRHHLWDGGKDLEHAMREMVTRQGSMARARVELWTGIDFVDTTKPSPGDAGDLARALLWLQRSGRDWDMTAVYRAGRKLPVEPLIDALTAAG